MAVLVEDGASRAAVDSGLGEGADGLGCVSGVGIGDELVERQFWITYNS